MFGLFLPMFSIQCATFRKLCIYIYETIRAFHVNSLIFLCKMGFGGNGQLTPEAK